MPAPRKPASRPPIDVYADPLTQSYENTVDRLLTNIAAHFNTDNPTTATVDWQFKKLAELGKLKNENLAIIAEMTQQNEVLLKEALTRAAIDALDGIEPQLAAAVKKGLLDAAADAPLMSARVKKLLNAYQNQALETLNLVNTVMLKSSLEQYRKVVSNTMVYERQLAAAQQILNQSTASVVLGAQSRQQALRQAVKDMANQGLYGFTDKAGRHWSPEAYVNMDIRTTAGNVATEAVFERNQDYGNDLIWWPILATARPGCYPWQGKVCSTTNRSGTVEDLDGAQHTIYPLSETTYGQPAGIGGINCHHKPPNVFIPGLSKVRGKVPSEDANDAKYESSQKQRYLERQVRYAKRDAAIADAMGDEEAFEDAAQRVKRARSNYNDFIVSTGRTRRGDRTQIYNYNQKLSSKVSSLNSAKEQIKLTNLQYIADDAKIKAVSGLPKVLNLPDESIPLTVEVNLPKLHGIVPEGTTATEVYVMAGAGTSTPIRDLPRLYAKYPGYGSAADWQKKSGTVYTDNYHYVVHWYENNGQVPQSEIKLKGVK